MLHLVLLYKLNLKEGCRVYLVKMSMFYVSKADNF